MAQHDYIIENQTGLDFRQDLNNVLQAIVTNNSGSVAPLDTFPGMEWLDTSSSPAVKKRRNQTNDAWDVITTDLSDNTGASKVGFKQDSINAVDSTVEDKLRQIVSVADFMTAQDLIDISLGTSSAGVRTAIKNAIAYINIVGGILYFPPGHYNTPYLNHTDFSNWIEITKSGVSFIAAPGSVVLENFLFYIHGSYSSPQNVGSAGFTTGDNQVNTAAAHGLQIGDYIQLLSSVNAGSVDAGDYQMESTSPTSLAPGELRLSEIHKVVAVPSTTTADIAGSIIYPLYKDNTTGYTLPLPGVSSAQIRKISMCEGVVFKGIGFKNIGTGSFREILARAVAGLVFEDCTFQAGTLSGQHFKCTDCTDIYFVRCRSTRNPLSITGSNWNSFLIGKGSQYIWFTDCHFEGESQTIDYTPAGFTTDPGNAAETAAVSSQMTVQYITMQGCTFIRCENGATTHPGCYNFTAIGNKVFDCVSGFTLRGLKNDLSGNTFETNLIGVFLGGFYTDSLLVSNQFMDIAGVAGWSGIQCVPMSSETMNRNNVKNVVISNNSFTCKYSTDIGRAGVLLRHYGNGVPVSGFTEFTDAIKTAKSDYKIENNKFTNCKVFQGKYINGVLVKGNSFSGGLSGLDSYILINAGAAAGYFDNNVFFDTLVNAFNMGAVNSLTYSYEKKHYIGRNQSLGNAVSTFAAGAYLSDMSISTGLAAAGSGGPIVGGTYTPTGTLSTNCAAVDTYSNTFTRIGNIVTISGQIRIRATATGDTLCFISIPIASDFTAGTDGSGVFSGQQTTDTGAIVANASGDNLTFRFTASTTTATIFQFNVSYVVK